MEQILLMHLELFLDDPDTDGIVLIGEIGGTAEIEGAEFIKSWKGKYKKPVAAFVAGAAAPKGRKLRSCWSNCK